MREPPAHRVVQTARRVRADRRAQPRREGGGRGGRECRKPCAGCRTRLFAARRTLHGLHARRRPLPKVAATREYGAEVRLQGHVVDETLAAAQEYAEQTGAVFIHPFDHPDIIAGQGTVGLEILEQCPEVRTVVVGIGGGGLAAGIAVAVKALRPDVKVVGVQAAGAAAFPPSLSAGHPVALDSVQTMADGIKVGRPGDLTFPLVQELVDEVRTVSEDELSSALLLCLERAKMVVEPAGASPVAALLSDPKAFRGPSSPCCRAATWTPC